ncbi:tautomerase family protein [Jeotgalibacillus proteolyticus]|uniref:Tautomerase family protein n=1 Tax=Jeotgalibacillus proteolyticus TaxID=2082395 RepID=A0A2S5G8B7_9BACL|nr:tautomerase family protein [Jeotgalibacillus proteolyticus]PPA69195.1 tautomerase family protein [Jeotgalibacillus proteolyticus]
MPLLKFHLYEGKSEGEIKKILDVTHEITVKTFEVPQRDRYQLVHEHKKYQMIMEDTGLGFERTDNFLLIHMVSRKRTKEQLTRFYDKLSVALRDKCNIAPTDLMISISPNGDEDWSFGEGKAQFITGDLS